MNPAFGKERRAWPRYRALPNTLSVEHGAQAQLVRSPARLFDVSRGGASFRIKCMPPPGRPLWLRLQEPVRTDWATARVVWFDSDNRVGVELQHACPFLLDAATLGVNLAARVFEAYQEEDSDSDMNGSTTDPGPSYGG
jgi:hypothetical protein